MELIISERTSTICKVCGANGAQQYYGGLCCPSCRVFFIRTVNRPGPYKCYRGGNCKIANGSKTNCKACRFKKCTEANMVVASVGRRKKEKDPDELPTDSLVPYFNSQKRNNGFKMNMNMSTKDLLKSLSVGYNFVDILSTKTDPIQFANELVKIEEICDNIHGPMPNSLNSNLDASLSDVLRHSQICCDRTSVSWNITVTTDTMTEFLHLAYCRCATLVADFISAAPEIHQICEKDRLRLVNANFCDLGLLTMLYNTWLRNVTDGLVFPHGFKFRPNNDCSKDDEMNTFLKTLISFLHEKIVPIFDKIQLTAQEYTLLKMIALFNGAMMLPDDSAEIVKKARSRYSKLLVDYVNQQFKFWSVEWRGRRIQDLFNILSLLRVASVYDNEYCVKLVTLNIGNMRGNLPFDIHVRSF